MREMERERETYDKSRYLEVSLAKLVTRRSLSATTHRTTASRIKRVKTHLKNSLSYLESHTHFFFYQENFFAKKI